MDKEVKCGFCGKTIESAWTIIKGRDGSCICGDCVKSCNQILFLQKINEEDASASPETDKTETPKTPAEIKEALDEYIVGQEEAKKTLAVAVYNHYKRVNIPRLKTETEIEKSNILMIGPTGSGKTLFAKTIAEMMDVPFIIADANALTEIGYKGSDVEDVMLRLYNKAGCDVARAEKGVVYIDEIDKIATRSGTARDEDISGNCVQQDLLKIIEGTEIELTLSDKTGVTKEVVTIDTKNILFICGGAFERLNEVIGKRNAKSPAIGFGAKPEKEEPAPLENVTYQDLKEYGMLSEFLGRLPVITILNELTKEDMIKVLTEPKNALVKQYESLLEMDGVKICFTQDALEAIADKALSMGTGARALRSIMEETMRDAMFAIPSDKTIAGCEITKENIESKKPVIFQKARIKRQEKTA